ncbi:MAG: hypothetical protein OT477_03025 [Chloroflexi bacterium]|nr:hypothetical protein [Chloroflexota bacterium]
MTLHSTYHIGQIIHNGRAFNTHHWASSQTMNFETLLQAAQQFFALLEQRQIPYVLVGGISLLHYVEGRNTQDLDLLMALSSLEKLPELEIASQDMYFVKANFGELPIDILLTENPLFRQVQRHHATTANLFDRPISIATVEGLLLLKLYALPSLYRQGNFARVGIHENDIATLLYYYQPDTAPLLRELAQHVSQTDFAELQNIVADMHGRARRFRQ